jgi:hypothetical protein
MVGSSLKSKRRLALENCVAGNLQRLEVMDERVVDDVGRREAIQQPDYEVGLYIQLDVGPQVVAGAGEHPQHIAMQLKPS